MQIISGKYRARKLISPNSARPTLQRIKISTFSLIQEFVAEGIEVLDLFAGSGALGIECISRGAKFATFVENDKTACNCIFKNIRGIENTYYEVVNADYSEALTKLSRAGKSFDIIFLDPPYENGYYIPALEKICRLNLCKEGGIIVVESLKDKKPDFVLENYEIYKSRDYGITNITVLRRVK